MTGEEIQEEREKGEGTTGRRVTIGVKVKMNEDIRAAAKRER